MRLSWHYGSSRRAASASRGVKLRRVLVAAAATGMTATLFTSTSAFGAATPQRVASVSANGCSSGSVDLTFWSGVTGINSAVVLFNQTHPGICVHWLNEAPTVFAKLLDAMKTGTGAPDITQFNYSLMYLYEQNHYLVNLAQYGANAVQADFPAYAWQNVSYNGGVYAIPQDSGVYALLYNAVLLKKYGLAVPTTWAQMITEGEALQAAHPGTYINDFAPNDSVNVLSGMTQAGARDFVLNGTKLSVGFTSPAAEQYASVWDTLLSKHLVASVPDFSTQWFNDLQNGQILTVLAQAWAPSYIGSSLDKTLGDWRVAPLPQFAAGQNVGMNGGGSPEAVTSQTKYPKQAAEFDIWLNTSKASLSLLDKPPSGLFPMATTVSTSGSFLNQKLPLTGSQELYRVYENSGPDPGFASGYGPFASYAGSEAGNAMDLVAQGRETVKQMFASLQNEFVSYAKQQGFTVVGS